MSTTAEETCTEPASLGHMDALKYTRIIRQQSYSLRSAEIYFADDGLIIPDKYINITFEHLSGHHGCPNSGSHGNHRHTVDNLNLCPIRYVRNFDSNRQPSLIIESECVCPEPLIETRLSCYPVTQYVKVYRRSGCHVGVYVYEPVWEPVRVACVAGFKISSMNLDASHKMPE